MELATRGFGYFQSTTRLSGGHVRSHHKSYHNQAAEYPGTNPELLVTAVTATRNRPGCPPRYILANLAIKSTILVT